MKGATRASRGRGTWGGGGKLNAQRAPRPAPLVQRSLWHKVKDKPCGSARPCETRCIISVTLCMCQSHMVFLGVHKLYMWKSSIAGSIETFLLHLVTLEAAAAAFSGQRWSEQ